MARKVLSPDKLLLRSLFQTDDKAAAIDFDTYY